MEPDVANAHADKRPFWLLLRGADAKLKPPSRPASRVVLVHGWLQSHRSWLRTAAALRDGFGHDVLLLDLYGHGFSDSPSAASMSPASYVELLEKRLAAVGWDCGPPLMLAGVSLGAAVAARFTARHPERVARLTLVCPPGLPEPWWMPCHAARKLAKAVVAAAPAEAASVHLLRVIRTTPDYDVPVDELLARAARGALRLTVYLAGFDIIHSPHLATWRAHVTRCSGAAGGGALRVVYLPYRTHWGVAEGLYALGLHRDEALWHEPCDGALGHGPSPPPRAKL
jgi:pimeloyl-ACP methyl ester carboxylesterase